ncbi:MAG TPA: DUF362 domain-containing protein [Armatimonadota bacterium]|jgi:uncharacterized protein (DUF362 family)
MATFAQNRPDDALRGKVAALRTSPETILEDVQRLMDLAGYTTALPAAAETLLKINISWHHYYPACSTSPWQLDGVTRAMLQAGWTPETLIPAQNATVVVDPKLGSVNNHLQSVIKQHGLEYVWLFEPEVEWVNYEPQGEMMVLPMIFPDGISIPKLFLGKNALHLPTVKTHVFTTTTGAMKNAFGGLLNNNRHWTHKHIHETLVDLLTIQKEIHPGLFAVMDGTIAGSGPGPRCMQPHVKNVILASADQVAIDAVAASMMGFDPLRIDYIRLAHEKGLGVGDMREIEVLGDEDLRQEDWGFTVGETLASRGQKCIYHGCLSPFEKTLLRTKISPWSVFASKFYHDTCWFPLVGSKRAEKIKRETGWGKLFESYG